jgi:integrase
LNGARLLVAQAKLALSQKRDPAGEKVAAKRRKKEPDRVDADSLFPAIAQAFVEKHCRANQHRRWINVSQTLGIPVDRRTLKFSDTYTKGSPADVWRSVHVRDLTKRQVLDLVDGFIERGFRTAALARWKVVRRTLRWCVSRDILAHSPLEATRPPVRGRSRERVLEPHEIRACWRAAVKLGNDYGDFVRFLMLTMVRRNEALRLPWTELNRDLTLWTLPGERAKNGVTVQLPLSWAAQDILNERPRDHALVFGELAHRNLAREKKRLCAIMQELLVAEGHTFKHFVQHDLRRTGCTLLAEHADQVVVEKLLNHQSALSQIGRIYNRASYAASMRKAIEKLADLVLEIVAEGKVE